MSGDLLRVAQRPNCRVVDKVRVEGSDALFNPYYYVPKYRSPDALPTPDIFLFLPFLRPIPLDRKIILLLQ